MGSPNRITTLRVVAGMVAVALFAAGCGSSAGEQQQASSGAAVVEVPGATRQPAPKGAPVDATVTGMNEFALALYKAAAKPEENFVFSPLSIAFAFAMARAGAKGETAQQLDRLFGFPHGRDAAFNKLTGALATASAPPLPSPTPGKKKRDPKPAPPILTLANALFVQNGYPLVDGFLRTLTEQYGSQVQAVDFTDEQAALDAVNGWANKYTAGRIPKILAEVDPLTRAVIANAVYLKADWTRPFIRTGEVDFTVAGQVVPVPMMERESSLGYAAGEGWQSVDIPYFGDTLTMRVTVPTGDTSPGELLTPTVLAAAAKTAPTEVDLTMPLWDFGTTLDLRDLMPGLGVTDLFEPDAADLSGITEAERLFIDQAVHKADITVDELGTVASAVTAVTGRATSAGPPPVMFTVDRPFVFQVIDVKTGATLFLGHVADPRAS